MLKEEQSSATGVLELETQARAAFEQRRTRDCVALTKSLLNADPENPQGQMLHSAIQRDMQRDLADASALLEESLSQTEGQKYKKAAEIILLKVLYLDPDNDDARNLLSKAKGTSETNLPSPSAPAPAQSQPLREEEIPFTTALSFEKKIEAKPRRLTIPIVLVAVVVLAGGLFLLKESRSTANADIPESFAAAQSTRSKAQPVSLSNAGGSNGTGTAPNQGGTLPPPVATSKTTENAPALATLKPGNSFDTEGAVAFVESGTLVVSSPVRAEIYLGDKHLGSTPITLQLLAGRQTLEYRYNDLRTVATHNIRANQTTTTAISFDVNVQINARPWAQVFVEGATRRALGQTPLSSVRVPLGSVLTFENPNFPSKEYRVTSSDTAIQVVFP